MISFKSILTNSSKFRICIYIFLLAFVFRVIIIKFYQTDTIAPDGVVYHKIAYNFSEGLGYSAYGGEKYFFREPGYPVFLSISFKISELFGNKLEPLSTDENFKILKNSPEVQIVKYIQALLDSFACVLLFLLISNLLNNIFASIIAIAFCFYYPYAIHVTNILRESLQSFLTLAMCYALFKYFILDKTKFLIMTGFLWGLLNLTFQANIIFAVSIPIFIWIHKKRFTKAIIPSIIVGLIMLATISPWLIRTYNEYPNLKIFRSLGTSFTPEYRDYYSSLVKSEYYGLINSKQMDSTFIMNLRDVTDNELFRHSFDGTFSKRADSLNTLVNEPFISKRKVKLYSINFYKSWFPTKIFSISTKELIKNKPLLAALILLPVVIISLFAFIGLVKYYPRFFKINITFTTLIAIFFIISTEYRRMLPVLPFIFLYGVLGIIFIYKKYYKRLNEKGIEESLFIQLNLFK
jgi:Dolichyl-phosphate-mannose-protein mannosyltransferase